MEDGIALGVYINQAGQSWPELTEQLLKLYRDRVAKLAFVPTSWYASVQALKGLGAPVIAPPYMGDGKTVRPGFPAWLANDPAALTAWAKVAEQARLIVFHYASNKVEEGRGEMARAYANAAFWDGLYNVAVAVADAPGKIVGAAADGAQRVAGGIFKSLFSSWLVWLVLLGGAAFAAWRFGFFAQMLRKGKK